MRKLKLYIAISLDGNIARPIGDVKWQEETPNPDHSDYGYADFYQSINTMVIGFNPPLRSLRRTRRCGLTRLPKFTAGRFLGVLPWGLIPLITYHEIIHFETDFPYPDKINYVFTWKTDKSDTKFVHFITGHITSFIKGLKKKEGKDIWLAGF